MSGHLQKGEQQLELATDMKTSAGGRPCSESHPCSSNQTGTHTPTRANSTAQRRQQRRRRTDPRCSRPLQRGRAAPAWPPAGRGSRKDPPRMRPPLPPRPAARKAESASPWDDAAQRLIPQRPRAADQGSRPPTRPAGQPASAHLHRRAVERGRAFVAEGLDWQAQRGAVQVQEPALLEVVTDHLGGGGAHGGLVSAPGTVMAAGGRKRTRAPCLAAWLRAAARAVNVHEGHAALLRAQGMPGNPPQ